jgi:hypothetical protein
MQTDFINYPTSKELLLALLLLCAIIGIIRFGVTLIRKAEPESLWDKFYKANPPKHEGELFDDIYNQD